MTRTPSHVDAEFVIGGADRRRRLVFCKIGKVRTAVMRGKIDARTVHWETGIKLRVAANADLQLVAMMVTKQLKTEHRIDDAPAVADYEIMEENFRHNGSTDVNLRSHSVAALLSN